MLRLFSSSMFRIHLLPCVCGSIIRGQREELHTMMPFSVDRLSFGRP